MDEPKGDVSEEVTRWSTDLRRQHPAGSTAEAVQSSTSAEDLIRYLETLTGRQYRSRKDVLQLLTDFWREDVEAARIAMRKRVTREALLLGVLAASYLHYYYWEVELKISAIPTIQVFVPVPPLKPDQRTYRLVRDA